MDYGAGPNVPRMRTSAHPVYTLEEDKEEKGRNKGVEKGMKKRRDEEKKRWRKGWRDEEREGRAGGGRGRENTRGRGVEGKVLYRKRKGNGGRWGI